MSTLSGHALTPTKLRGATDATDTHMCDLCGHTHTHSQAHVVFAQSFGACLSSSFLAPGHFIFGQFMEIEIKIEAESERERRVRKRGRP